MIFYEFSNFTYLPIDYLSKTETGKNMDNLTEELKIKLIDLLNLVDVKPEDIDENAQFVGGELGIDSIDVLEMVVMIEKDYGVSINNKEMGEKVFATLTALAQYITENSK
jgi:acyl carrier protein